MNKFSLISVVFSGLLVSFFSACTVSKYTHNESVEQQVLEKNEDNTVVVQAGKIYEAGDYKRFMLGDHYRDVWLAPVEVPIIDFDREKGGLTILNRGGGMQTYSLKLKGGDGHLYSLRSIQKDPTPTLPYGLRYSFADDIVQDQISASNPYAAFILPSLGDAAGIYHTNPKLFYIPDDPELGKYRKEFGGALAMLEEDADEDWSGYKDFGGTENAVSTTTVMDELRNDNDNYVDEKNLLKARLFDMWINDWDRHEGQFRWAELEDGNGKYYRPIPEDRDNMFFKFDGFLPWWASRKWALRKFQDFQPDVRDIAGLNFNAQRLDRRFLTGLSKDEWLLVVDDLQDKLNDEVIEKAVHQFPDTVYALIGNKTISTLKARRNNLKKFAEEYYKILAKQVDILGSDKDEVFEVIRKGNNDTELTMYKAKGDGEKGRQLYHRLFHNEETEEIRIYGLGDDDYFVMSGKSNHGPLVRIIGGKGEDKLVDSSLVKGLRKKAIYYDDIREENTVKNSRETKLVLNNDADNNSYDFRDFEYDYLGPTLYFGLNKDDGIFFGGGVIIKTYGFRKDPYATKHRIVANFAPNTSAWNFEYQGDFVKVLGEMGLNLDLLVRAPNFFTNFYGYGNSSEQAVEDDDFYRVRFDEISFNPGLTLQVGEKSQVKFGPAYQYAKVKSDGKGFIDQQEAPINPDIFKKSHFGGFSFKADVRTTDIEAKPEKGIRWITETTWLNELNNDNSKLSKFSSEFRAYYTVDLPFETTLAVRIGGASISGDFNFYQASTIGGNAGLSRLGTVRGFSRDRFSGRSSIYQNTEIRIRLLKVPFYYMPFEFGISGHIDQGRVWSETEESDKWHRGIGGGLWIAPLGRWVFTAVYTESDEDSRYNFNLGFLF